MESVSELEITNQANYFLVNDEQASPTLPIVEKKQRIRKKDLKPNTVPVERVEHYYSIVTAHLRAAGTWKKTVAKFPPRAIYGAVKQIIERLSSTIDFCAEFEQLRDHETVQDFIESLHFSVTHTKQHHYFWLCYRLATCM